MRKFLPGATLLGLMALSAPLSIASVDMSMIAFGTTYAEPGQEYQFYNLVTNKGTEEITSLTYTQTMEGYEDRSFTVEFSPIEAGAKRYVALTAVAPDELDVTVSAKLQVTAINGETVNKNAVSGKISTLPFVPVHRPLIEDYTGTWCRYCPRGYVAIEGVHRDYPDQVLCIAYHNSDPMAVSTYADPQTIGRWPTLKMNRASTDASASSVGINAIRTYNSVATASVTLDACEWLDADHSEAYAKATVEFANLVSNGECKIEFVLIQDGLTGETASWKQENNFSGRSAEWTDPLWDTFTKGASKVAGLEFNDVCMANTLKIGSGFTASIPETTGRTPISFEYTFSNVNKIKEYGSASRYLLQNPDKCRIAAILSNRSSKAVINCDWAPIAEASGVTDVNADSIDDASAEKEYFTIEGIKVSSDNLTPGLYILRQGKKASKVVIR